MPEHLPDRCQPGAVSQHVGGQGVAQPVRADLGRPARRQARSTTSPTRSARIGPRGALQVRKRCRIAPRGGRRTSTRPAPRRRRPAAAAGPHGVLCPGRRSRRAPVHIVQQQPGHLDRARPSLATSIRMAYRGRRPAPRAGCVEPAERRRAPSSAERRRSADADWRHRAAEPDRSDDVRVKEPHQRPSSTTRPFAEPARPWRIPAAGTRSSRPRQACGANTPSAVACSARNRRAVFS